MQKLNTPKKLQGEILSTGDEIRTGAVTDTNATYIATQLIAIGVDITRHTCIGDDSEQLAQVLAEIGNRSDIAIVTGGLGPTDDDITRKAVADFMGKSLIPNESAMASVNAYFRDRGRPKGPRADEQAYLPEGSECLTNPKGTAPGFRIYAKHCHFYFLPGVPHEMRAMLKASVIPDLLSRMGESGSRSFTQTLSLFGLPESVVNEKLNAFPGLFPGIKLGFRAVFPEIQVKLYAKSQDPASFTADIQDATAYIKLQLGDFIFSMTGNAMEAEVGKRLLDQNATIALAESCTGGLIAHLLTQVAGSSGYFLFSAVTYANAAKTGILGVSPETLANHGAVSEKTVTEMAQSVRKITDATYGLATSGIAGPSGGTPAKPVGTVWIALATKDETLTLKSDLSFEQRNLNKRLFAMLALDVLRRKLTGLPLPKLPA